MKKSLTTTILALAIILTLLFGVVYYYMYSKLQANNEQVATLGAEADLETGEEQNTIALRSSIQATSNERALIHSLFIGKDETASLIEKLEGIATLANVTHELSVDTRQDDGLSDQNKEMLVTTMKVTGTWPQVYRFLGLLENLPYKVTITNARLNHVEIAGPKSVALGWSANISAIFIKEK